jgi:hypothetical protein
MTATTSHLSLNIPGNGDYIDTWDQILNENFEKLDLWAQNNDSEVIAARYGYPTLRDFLDVSFNNDGSLKATPEIIKARSSFSYGDELPSADDFELADRLNQGDKEVFTAREGYSDLKELSSVKSLRANMVLLGAKDVNGYPTWLGFTGANAHVDGDVEDVIFSIGGYLGRVRGLEQITISGAVGVKHLYAEYNSDGIIRVDGDSSTPPPASANGVLGSDGFKVRIFEDSTVDFTSVDVNAGDILDILGTGANAGNYLIDEVAPGGNINRLKIKGVFPAGSQAGLNYVIRDPMAVTLGFDDTKTPAQGKLYIGEADWDGIAVTEVRALHFEDYFVGEWRAVDISVSTTFTEAWNHKLFDDAIEVQVHVSQANDGSAPVEMLSTSQINNTLDLDSTLAINNTLVLSAGDQSLSGDVSLTGTVDLVGSLLMGRSVKTRWTNKQVTVSNIVNNLFYKDYNGVDRDTGYVRVVIKKLRR